MNPTYILVAGMLILLTPFVAQASRPAKYNSDNLDIHNKRVIIQDAQVLASEGTEITVSIPQGKKEIIAKINLPKSQGKYFRSSGLKRQSAKSPDYSKMIIKRPISIPVPSLNLDAQSVEVKGSRVDIKGVIVGDPVKPLLLNNNPIRPLVN